MDGRNCIKYLFLAVLSALCLQKAGEDPPLLAFMFDSLDTLELFYLWRMASLPPHTHYPEYCSCGTKCYRREGRGKKVMPCRKKACCFWSCSDKSMPSCPGCSFAWQGGPRAMGLVRKYLGEFQMKMESS